MNDLELKEILAHIDQRLLNNYRTRPEVQLAPWKWVLAGFAAGVAGAAPLAADAALGFYWTIH